MAGEQPPTKSLGVLWEKDEYVRERARKHKKLIRWAEPRLKGVQCNANVVMNVHQLEILGGWWCPQKSEAKSPPIEIMKKQVGLQQSCCKHFLTGIILPHNKVEATQILKDVVLLSCCN